MLTRIRSWWPARLKEFRWPSGWMWKGKSKEPEDELTRLTQETRAAWSDYEAAHIYFNYVKDPELIDHSIYRLEAAKKRFTYLWNQLRALKRAEKASEGA